MTTPKMRATTRDEKIANPGVYTVPAQRQPLTASTILNLMPSSIPPEHDGALLDFARAIEATVIDAANAKANGAWPLMCEKRVEAEREACAKAVEDMNSLLSPEIAAAIRARGQASILGAELP